MKVLFYSIPSAKDLLDFHYCVWNIPYSTLFCCQSNNIFIFWVSNNSWSNSVACIICNHASPRLLWMATQADVQLRWIPVAAVRRQRSRQHSGKQFCITINMQIINKNITILYGLKLWECICVCSWKCNVFLLIKMNFY